MYYVSLVNYFSVYTPLEAFLFFPPFPIYIISISLASLCNCYFVLLHCISNIILHWHGHRKIYIYGLFLGGHFEGADNTALTFMAAVLTLPLQQHICTYSPHSDDVLVTTVVRAPCSLAESQMQSIKGRISSFAGGVGIV